MKYNDFTKIIEKPYFTRRELALRGISLYDAQIINWIKNGLILRVKRGFYVFSDKKNEISPSEIAFFLYEPSYISMETALNIYGLIPDVTQSIVSVSTKATRRFTNEYGHFIYHTIPSRFFFGYIPKNEKNGKYLLATPEKALVDYVYFHRGEIKTTDDVRELRINCDILKDVIDKKKLQQYLTVYKSPSLEKAINLIFTTCLPIKN
jgi:predicted transcriptional regulator of viral defense system